MFWIASFQASTDNPSTSEGLYYPENILIDKIINSLIYSECIILYEFKFSSFIFNRKRY